MLFTGHADVKSPPNEVNQLIFSRNGNLVVRELLVRTEPRICNPETTVLVTVRDVTFTILSNSLNDHFVPLICVMCR